jgi:guanylate kinase
VTPEGSGRHPLTIVVSGPGGVGKGTIVDALVERDPQLRLSRSWTTRAQRAGEPDSAYVFTTREEFERRIAEGGFLEWTEFLGNYYGTPMPEPGGGADLPDSPDLVLEIEVDGAQQVKAVRPDALLIFILPPTRAEQERRLRARGDEPDTVVARLRKAEDEEPTGLAIADHMVVNDDLDETVERMLKIINQARSR